MTDQITEKWKIVPNFPSYRISTSGNLETRSRRGSKTYSESWRPVKLHDSRYGYLSVTLYNHPIKRYVAIHRLMGEVFLKKPISTEKLVVRHLDGVRHHNEISNLAWGTYSENSKDMVRHGHFKNNCVRNLSELDVKIIRLLKGRLKQRTIAKYFCVSATTISNVIKDKAYRGIQFD